MPNFVIFDGIGKSLPAGTNSTDSARIAGELAKISGFIKSSEAKLANKAFVDHAPAAIVEEAKRKLAENKDKVAQLEKLAKLFA